MMVDRNNGNVNNKFLILCVISVTRAVMKNALFESYSSCTLQIIRNAHLDKLLISRRSARIVARRRTIALDDSCMEGSLHSNLHERSILFKNVASKPFSVHRRSFAGRVASQTPIADSMHNQACGQNDSIICPMIDSCETEQVFNKTQVESSQIRSLEDEGECSITAVVDTETDNVSSNEQMKFAVDQMSNHDQMPSIDQMSDDNYVSSEMDLQIDITERQRVSPCDNDSLLPLLATIDVHDECFFPVTSQSVLDAAIPSALNLPAPLQPLNFSKRLRPVPNLLPMCDLIEFNDTPTVKKYPAAKKFKASKFIIQCLEQIDEQRASDTCIKSANSSHGLEVESTNISPGLGLNESDEKFGKLFFSDESE